MTTIPLPAVFALAGLVLHPGPAWAQVSSEPVRAATQTAAALRARGLALGFNLDRPEALAAFREAIAADPGDPASYRLVAATLWSEALFRKGAVTAEDFLSQTGSSTGRRTADPDLQNAIGDVTRRVDALAAARRRNSSLSDAEASYQIGAAYGLLASYAATIEGDELRSLGYARRAYRAHRRVLALDPRRKDAGLLVGLYRFAVSIQPAWLRLLARVAGLDADREGGIRLVEDTAATAGPAQVNALFSLIFIYNQGARYDDALRVIGRLQQQFPRNRLLWLEEGCTKLRAGRPAPAREALERGLAMLEADARPRAFGELARWRYHYGVALAQLNQLDQANQQLHAALQGDGLDWVRERTHVELRKLAKRRK